MAKRVDEFPVEARPIRKVQLERLQERERDFALRLGVTDGGRYKNDWYSRIDALLAAEAKADGLERELAEVHQRKALEAIDRVAAESLNTRYEADSAALQRILAIPTPAGNAYADQVWAAARGEAMAPDAGGRKEE